jgi:hypothetical protein
MSSCLIRGVRSVELVSSNLAEAARFYADVWKLAPAETRNNAQYFRGTGSYHHVLGLNLGNQPAVIRVVFDLADRHAITVLHRAMSGAGLKSTAPAELSTPGRGYGFGCKDPNRTRCRWNIPPRSCRSTTPTGRAMGLLEIHARPLRPMGDHAAALAALLSRAAPVWFHRGRRSDCLSRHCECSEAIQRQRKSLAASSLRSSQ